ncbi:hypothetical protein KVV02_005117 [Mortierella alpina]|uniref:Uncharacterized protein n=1 Tax=Mortierella alpina TaxID=64518 RepID=A0A9P8A944_MORAP|nr:hypothetical protein KVV02_005117 [Mortierella alpina]
MHLTTTILVSAGALAMSVAAQGQIASLDAADNYCFFLPPMVGGDIAQNEDSAIAFCNKANPKAPEAKIFPDGFVLSAHWASSDSWVQITGQIDPAKYNLNPCDAGGQYDIRAPVGASCAGFSHFVNVIEPTDGVYGMKCCQNKEDCVVSKSTFGVRVIYGSQYDFSGPRPDGPLPASVGCVNGSLPGGSNTTVPSASVPSSPSASASVPIGGVTGSASVSHPAATSSAASPSASVTPNKANDSTRAGASSMVVTAATTLFASALALFLA